MARPKPIPTEILDDEHLRMELARLQELIHWIAPRIERRTANGTISRDFCLFCILGPPNLRRPCRHAEIWSELNASASD
jgi:hypothetical protein